MSGPPGSSHDSPGPSPRRERGRAPAAGPSSPSISVAIRAHPRRAAWIPHLVERIDAPVDVIWDRRNDPWDSAVRALLEADRHAEYRMILEDDALVCRDLVAGCRRALRYVPEATPVGLFVGANMHPEMNRRLLQIRAAGRSWMVDWGPWWGVGLIVPTADVEAIVEFGPTCQTPKYDSRVALYFKRRGRACWYSVPSLVEHRPLVENPSIENPAVPVERQAQWFIGEDASALDVDFATGAVGPRGELME